MIHWLLRAKRLAQNPPSWQRVKLGLWVVAICLCLAAYEAWFGWPEFLTLNEAPRRGPIGLGR